MTESNLDQNASVLQGYYKTLLRRTAHLELLMGQLRDDVNKVQSRVPCRLRNQLLKLVIKMDNSRQDFVYLVNKQADIELQRQNKPLIIKGGKR